jgi:hypothetical protein
LIDSGGASDDNRRVGKGQSGTVAPEVQEMASDPRGDDSGDWTLEDATPQDALAVLSILREVERRSAGRIRRLTRREARLAAVYHAAGHDPWAAYVAAREYLTLANGGADLAEETLALARSTGEQLALEPADELDVDYPAGMIDPPIVNNGT